MTATKTNAIERVSDMRTRLVLDHSPFYAMLSLRLKLKPTATGKIAVNGTHLLFNPEYVESIDNDVLMTRIAQAATSCSLLHPYRLGHRDPKLYSEACEYAVMELLKSSGFALPEDAKLDPKYQGLAAEEIYADLERQQQQQTPPPSNPSKSQAGGQDQQPSGGQSGQPKDGNDPADNFIQPPPASPQPGKDDGQPSDQGEGGDQPGNSEQDWQDGDAPQGGAEPEQQMTEHDWQVAAESIAAVCRKAGNMPGEHDRMLQKGRETRTDWREKMRRFVQQSIASDYSWSKPSRRMIGQRVILPGVIREGMPWIGMGCDTSGSVAQRYLKATADELATINRELKPEGVTVWHCDALVTLVEQFGPDDEIELHPKGGGGTSFRPVFDAFEAACEEHDYKCLLFFSEDLECFDERHLVEPAVPVMWIVPSYSHKKTMPFGEVVLIDPEEI